MTGCVDCIRSPNGMKACPICWNCPTWMDKEQQAWRLQHKTYSVDEWYLERFRSDIRASDIICNG